jgi:hypothetical protein
VDDPPDGVLVALDEASDGRHRVPGREQSGLDVIDRLASTTNRAPVRDYSSRSAVG